MAKQSEWSVMRDQDKWLTVPLRGYICVDVVERRVCWIREENVMDRCNWSLFVILPIVDYYRRYVDFFFLTELIRGSFDYSISGIF